MQFPGVGTCSHVQIQNSNLRNSNCVRTLMKTNLDNVPSLPKYMCFREHYVTYGMSHTYLSPAIQKADRRNIVPDRQRSDHCVSACLLYVTPKFEIFRWKVSLTLKSNLFILNIVFIWRPNNTRMYVRTSLYHCCIYKSTNHTNT